MLCKFKIVNKCVQLLRVQPLRREELCFLQVKTNVFVDILCFREYASPLGGSLPKFQFFERLKIFDVD